MEMGAESGTKHTYASLEEMLQLANLGKVCVEGDGNCGFYALHLASSGSLDHSSMDRSASTPTAGDYAAQQVVRAKCHSWLTGPGKALVASQLKADLEQRVTPPSRWQSDQIEKILQGKQGWFGNTGLVSFAVLSSAAPPCAQPQIHHRSLVFLRLLLSSYACSRSPMLALVIRNGAFGPFF